MYLKKILILFSFLTFTISLNAEEIKNRDLNTEFNIYTGMFDFSDDGKKSTLIGLQHQNENLNRDTFLGNLSPITGALITADNAAYVYTGVEAQYKIGSLNFNPSFTPGLYHEGDGKDLGHDTCDCTPFHPMKMLVDSQKVSSIHYCLQVCRG